MREGLSEKMVHYKTQMKWGLLCRNRWMENSKRLFRVQRPLSRMPAMGRKWPAGLEKGNVISTEVGVGELSGLFG